MKILKFVLCAIIALAVAPLFADEAFCVSGGALQNHVGKDGNQIGGFGEFGFRLYSKGSFFVWDHLTLRGYSFGADGKDYGALTISDKLIIGGNSRNGPFRTYGFIEGGAGIGLGGVAPSVAPLFSCAGGGGIDVLYDVRSSFFIEFGGQGFFAPALGVPALGGMILELGWRGFF